MKVSFRSHGSENTFGDVMGAFIAIAFTLSLMAVVALAIRIDSCGPVLSRTHDFRRAASWRIEILTFRTVFHET